MKGPASEGGAVGGEIKSDLDGLAFATPPPSPQASQLTRSPRFGAARIVTSADGTYRPDQAGEWAAVMGVHDRFGELVDLVSWFPDDEYRCPSSTVGFAK